MFSTSNKATWMSSIQGANLQLYYTMPQVTQKSHYSTSFLVESRDCHISDTKVLIDQKRRITTAHQPESISTCGLQSKLMSCAEHHFVPCVCDTDLERKEFANIQYKIINNDIYTMTKYQHLLLVFYFRSSIISTANSEPIFRTTASLQKHQGS